MFLSSNSFRQACKQQSSHQKNLTKFDQDVHWRQCPSKKDVIFVDVHVEKSLPVFTETKKYLKNGCKNCYFPDPPIPNPGAPNSADKTDDISRLFIYYVGRKKDQYLDGFHCGGGWAVSLVNFLFTRQPRRSSQGPKK